MADLITLSRLEQGVPQASSESDDWLESLISAASTMIENWCGRVFTEASYVELADGKEDGCIVLNQYPVRNVYQIHTGSVDVFRIQAGSGFGTSFTMPSISVNPGSASALQPYVTLLRFTGSPSAVPAEQNYQTGLGYLTTITQLATDIEDDGVFEAEALTGYSAFPAMMLRLQGPKEIANTGWTYLDAWESLTEVVDADFEAGMIYGNFSIGKKSTRVYYKAGYSTIPEDIQQACVSVVAWMLDAAKRDSSLKSEKLGDYAYTLMDSMGKASMPPQAAMLLAPYRSRRVVA